MAKKILNIPDEKRLLCIIAIGHPAESPEKARRSIWETTFTDSYGRPAHGNSLKGQAGRQAG
jgi:nitroreductase